jgi:branched-chain amino acid transport system ATP-binding protein
MILEARNLSISFGGVAAVKDVSIFFDRQKIVALIGPNGAGKTTVFNLLSGFLKGKGEILFENQNLAGLAPHQICRLGLARTFQIVQPFATQTVRENVAVGAHLRHRGRAEALKAAEAVAARVGLAAELDKPASSLTIAGRKRLELARALATAPKLLLLDEVLAGLNPREIADMIPVVRGLRESGITVLMVEHVMQAVMNLADEAWVLSNGRLIAHGTPAQVTSEPAVVEAYLGRMKIAHA